MSFRKLMLVLLAVLLGATLAHADLDLYLHDLNVSARADLGDFKAQVGAHFGVSGHDLDLVFRGVYDPADAVVCLWLGKHSRQPYDVVLREYRARKGQGWGALAQSLGIKPGSPEFKALKAGNLEWQPVSRSGHGKERRDEHGNMHGEQGKEGKDHSKGKDK